jgi:hypothetical protein
MISRSSANMDQILCHTALTFENLFYTLGVTVPNKISWKRVTCVQKLGHIAHILKKLCLHLRGYCCDPTNLTIGQKG